MPFQAENGLIGMQPLPNPGLADENLSDPGGSFVGAVPGACIFDSCMSFGLIRGGHLDVTVLGGLEVDERDAILGQEGTQERGAPSDVEDLPGRAARPNFLEEVGGQPVALVLVERELEDVDHDEDSRVSSLPDPDRRRRTDHRVGSETMPCW